jgi:serine/threonine protein kinase
LNGLQLTLQPIQLLTTCHNCNEMPASQKQRRITIETWNGDIQNLPCIGNGISGLVFEIDVRRVAKVALGTARSIEDIERERKIYRRFKQMLPNPDCHYILSCLESDNPRGLVFERCKGMVRSRLRSPSPILPEAVMKWAIQAAKGLGFVHDCGIIQGDG